jgi:murein L,D-transpeptidase YafK
MRFRFLGATLALGAMLLAGIAQAHGFGASQADLVVVIKSARVLYLYDQGRLIGQYPIALGLNPSGPKRERGDDKTPEGTYILDWRNPNSRFDLSIHISYPNARDRTWAATHGVKPGNNIMIHGQPNYAVDKRTGDWTHGCIAVSNAAMAAIWAEVPDGTPIHIYP